MCTCISKVNNKLADYNGLLVTNFLTDPPRAMISVCKKVERQRNKPPLMEASHCPFCGKKYKESKRALTSAYQDVER